MTAKIVLLTTPILKNTNLKIWFLDQKKIKKEKVYKNDVNLYNTLLGISFND